MQPDETDWQIINMLSQKHLPNSTVAKKLGLSEGTIRQRIKKLQDAGYTVRIRIDPIVPVENWAKEYKNLIDYLFEYVKPERITIGSLRGLQSTINNCEDTSWVEYLDERSNWGKKIGFDTRLDMYETIIGYLKNEYRYTKIGLCKETVEMWKELGLDYKKIKCNCIL